MYIFEILKVFNEPDFFKKIQISFQKNHAKDYITLLPIQIPFCAAWNFDDYSIQLFYLVH